jgi:hypothetical protein
MDKVTYQTSKGELMHVGLPAQTATYKPISHEQLIDLTLNSIQGAGFQLENEWYESAREGQIATGHYAIRNIADNEMQLRIAWQNSYNKQVSLKFALGVHVFVCSNGCVSGDMGAFRRKHTGDVQEFTPKTIEEYIHTAGEVFIQMQRQRDRMKDIQLSKRVQAELLGRMYIEENFIESTQLNIIKREISKPTHDYGAPNSLWEMYQFTTYAMRDVHPSLWMKNHLAANSFFVSESGLLVPQSEVFALNEVGEDAPNQVSMFEVPGFVGDVVETPTGIEIENPAEEVEEPRFGPSDVDYTSMTDDSKLDVKQYPATPEDCIEGLKEEEFENASFEDAQDPPIDITTVSGDTTEYSDLM